MNDIRDFLTLLKGFNQKFEKLDQLEKFIKDMDKPEFHKLRDILELKKAHEYSWSSLTILQEHQPFKKISNIIEEIKTFNESDKDEDSDDGENSDSSVDADGDEGKRDDNST